MFICPITDMEGGGVMSVTIPANQIRTSHILMAVCDVWGVEKANLLSSRRTSDLTKPRFCAFIIFKEHTPRSLADVGRVFNKDHASIIYGLRRAVDLLSSDEDFKELHKKTMDRITQIQDRSEILLNTVNPKRYQKPQTKKTITTRHCLKCSKEFNSSGPGNRLCSHCSTQASKNSEFEGVAT